jgi:hypothetical protein
VILPIVRRDCGRDTLIAETDVVRRTCDSLSLRLKHWNLNVSVASREGGVLPSPASLNDTP